MSAATPNASSQVPVLIRPGSRPVQTDSEWQADQQQLRPDGTIVPISGTTGSLLDSLIERLAPTAQAQTFGSDSSDFLYDELWSEPRNLVGSPRNRILTSSAIGAVLPEGSNFEFSVPLYGLSGRGLPAGIALNYNSRTWSRHGSAVTFNAVNSWPYIGFTLSFGRIVTYGASSATKFVLIDSDGTRHYLGSGPISSSGTYQNNDGSHITYVGDGVNGGTLFYNNGMTKGVCITNNRLLARTVTDTNGNYINISYASQPNPPLNCAPSNSFLWMQAIDTITDTLGRVIQFNYDDCNNLTSIDVPGYGGTSQNPVTTTIARFDYTLAQPSTSFSGLTVENVPTGSGYVPLLSHVYLPATDTGYKFSYSVYGMISTVSLRKDMSYNSGKGIISDGTEKAYVSFNYPASASSLTDAPGFSQWTQYLAATSGGTATCSITGSTGFGGGGTWSYTITNPDSSTLTLTRSTASGTTANGLLTQTEVKTSASASMAKSVISYTTDGGGPPQVANIMSYDDATPTPNQTKVDFDYNSYGNITSRREYGFQQSGSWAVRRRTRNVYKTDTSYVNAYLRSLVIEMDIYDAQLDTNDSNDVLVAKTTYTYDDYNAMGGIEGYGGTSYSIGHHPGYDASVTLRGNVTGVTEYTDVSAPTSITHLRKIDIFGNVVKQELSCCNQQAMNTDDENGYLMPVTVERGDPSGTMLTTTYGSDFNTSLRMSVEDANSQTTTVSSRDAALHPTEIELPTGAVKTASYDDSTLSVTQSVTYDDGGTQKSVTETTIYDGWGRVIQQVDINGGQINTSYDNRGRVASVSNPFTAGGTPSYSMTYSYDVLGRVTTITLLDTQTVQTNSTRTDARGVVTTNSYDALHRLSQTSYNTVSGVTTAPTVSYIYDEDSGTGYSTTAVGKLLRITIGSDYQERYTFDSSYRKASTVRTIGTRTYTTGYSYNEASQMTQLAYASGLAIAITRNTSGQIIGLQNASTQANYLGSVSYDVAGQITADTLGNGVTEQYGYDGQRMQLTSQKAGTTPPYTNSMDLTYGYSATAGQMGAGSTAGNAGQLMSVSGTINGTTESATYTYDNIGQLVTSNQTSNSSSAQRRFAYDRWSNRTGVWDAVSGGTQIQSVSYPTTIQGSGSAPTNRIGSVTSGSNTVNYVYDAAGNVTNDGSHTYTYDSENRLVSVDSRTTAQYAYDNQNQRYKKTVGGTLTHYVWEESQVVAEHNGSTGAAQVEYIYGGRRMIAKVAGSTTNYFLSDRLSGRLMMDGSGNVVGRQAHLPFGEAFAESGTQQKQHFTSY